MWGFFIALLLVPAIGSFTYFVLSVGSDSSRLLFSTTKIVMLIAPLVWIVKGRSLPALGFKNNPRRALSLGLTTGIAAAAIILIGFLVLKDFLEPLSNHFAQKFSLLGSLQYLLPIGLAFSIFHSLFEEYFWRWYVVGGLQTVMLAARATILGNFFFTLHHVVLLSLFFDPLPTALFSSAIWLAGIVWSLLYQKTGSLLASWFSHALADAAIFFVLFFLLK